MVNVEQLGPYRIEDRIGRGGMGEVFRGVHAESGERAAIKVLYPALASGEGFRERFEGEIDSLRQLSHPSIVGLHGFGEQDGILFYAMELVDGHSLESEVEQGRHFSWREVTSVGIQVCKALKHAHDHGIIHRDLKPANLLITDEGTVKLLDFGIARLFGASNTTSAGGVLGTADYMSPEQADGRPVTDRCDQYGLGGVMYCLLAGRPPFRAKSLPELLQLQRYADPEPVSRYAEDVPEDLEQIIMQLLAKEPEKRFPNAGVVARRLQAMARALSRPRAEGDDDRDQAEFRLTTDSPAPDGGSPSATIGVTDDGSAAQDLQPVDSSAPTRQVSRGAAVSPEENLTPEPPVQRPNTFVSVEELKRRERVRERRSIPLMIAQSVLALVCLALLVLAVWYLMRPPSAETLYDTIAEHAEEDRLDKLLLVDEEIEEFLRRYPNHPRAGKVAAFREDMLLARTERKLRTRVKLADRRGDLLPVERMYVEAMRFAEDRPEIAIERLRAIADLYGGEPELKPNEELCLKLARRQFDRLRAKVYQYAPEERKEYEARFRAAEKIRETDPERARRMCAAIVELGADKPWAAKPVADAQALLREMEAEKKVARREAEASTGGP